VITCSTDTISAHPSFRNRWTRSISDLLDLFDFVSLFSDLKRCFPLSTLSATEICFDLAGLFVFLTFDSKVQGRQIITVVGPGSGRGRGRGRQRRVDRWPEAMEWEGRHVCVCAWMLQPAPAPLLLLLALLMKSIRKLHWQLNRARETDGIGPGQKGGGVGETGSGRERNLYIYEQEKKRETVLVLFFLFCAVFRTHTHTHTCPTWNEIINDRLTAKRKEGEREREESGPGPAPASMQRFLLAIPYTHTHMHTRTWTFTCTQDNWISRLQSETREFSMQDSPLIRETWNFWQLINH